MADFNALKNPGFYNMDCMEALRAFPDNYFELSIADPPYGDGQGGDGSGRFGGMFAASIDGGPTRPHYNRFWRPLRSLQAPTNNPGAAEKPVERRGGQWAAKYGNHIIAWDVAPPAEYFEQLFRVSQNQVIWGGQLLLFAANAVLRGVSQDQHTPKGLQHGTGGVRLDVV